MLVTTIPREDAWLAIRPVDTVRIDALVWDVVRPAAVRDVATVLPAAADARSDRCRVAEATS